MTLNLYDRGEGIGWTDGTWNWIAGCAKTSEGCAHCWAEDILMATDVTPEDWTIVNLDENLIVRLDAYRDLERLPGPRWLFSPAVSDPFVPTLPWPYLMAAVGVMWRYSGCCFQVLTKWGPERARSDEHPDPVVPPLPENVMLGVTVETPRRLYRLDWLREQEAAMKFVSFEPLLEPISEPDLSGIDWAIIGGESGTHRRPMDPEWATDLIVECSRQDTAPFFKQHSDYRPEQRTEIRMGDWKGEVREFPATPDGVVDAPQDHLFEQTELGGW